VKRPSYRLSGLLALVLLFAAACQRPEEPARPAQLLTKEQMVVLLADLHVLEAQVENSRLSNDSARALYLAQQKELIWRREIDDSVFYRSYRYYSIHGKDLDEIYNVVLDTLSQREYRLGTPK
jgi:hypothetical protein